MYRKNENSWLKHWDFMLLDLLMLQAAYIFSCMVRNGWINPYKTGVYLNIGIIICLAHICAAFFTGTYHGIIRRGYFQEFKNVVQLMTTVAVIEVSYLYLSKRGGEFSRISFVIFAAAGVCLLYAERVIWKGYLRRYKKFFREKGKMLIVTSAEEAERVLNKVVSDSYNEFEIIGIVIADRENLQGEMIQNIPVVCAIEAIPDYIQTRWVDSILISLKRDRVLPENLIGTCVRMGVTVHCRIAQGEDGVGIQQVGRVGGLDVLTSSLRMASEKELLAKRALDILGGLAGICLTAVIAVFLAPAIYIASPGPIFFSQTRIGKNGKKFRIYKFRSMYMDAEKRKQELMEKNQMKGFMFKMDADPRIIGSGPDGTRHGLGWFIRKTSLDEFPQFWNVLKGDMSLVGTRPPTVDEWNQYEYHHRARMSIKPGLTGMWQVSGRSDITDFEEVVKLDMKYVRDWSIGMDIKILMKTVMVVAVGNGSK